MLRQLPARQRIRKALVILAFLSFPVTMNFLSPYVIIDAAQQGFVNGSLVMFGLMFLSSLFLGARLVRLGLPRRRDAGDYRAGQPPPSEAGKN